MVDSRAPVYLKILESHAVNSQSSVSGNVIDNINAEMLWLSRMENNPYNLIHFEGDDYEKLAVLNIAPKPETMIKVMMLTQALDHKISYPLQDITPLKKTRKGYTAVEWGGSVIDRIPD